MPAGLPVGRGHHQHAREYNGGIGTGTGDVRLDDEVKIDGSFFDPQSTLLVFLSVFCPRIVSGNVIIVLSAPVGRSTRENHCYCTVPYRRLFML